MKFTQFASLIVAAMLMAAPQLEASIHFKDSTLLTIIINKPTGTVRVVADGSPTFSQANIGLVGLDTSLDTWVNPQLVVSQNENSTTIATLSGTVNFTLPDGTVLKIDAGSGAQLDNNGKVMTDSSGNAVRPLAALLASDTGSALKAAILEQVATIAADVTDSGNTPEATKAATTQLAAVMKLMAQVDPEGAPALITTAVATLTKNGGTGATVTNAVSAVVAAAGTNSALSPTSIQAAAKSGAAENGTILPDSVTMVSNATTTINNSAILTTPITPIDISVVSPSGGKK